MDSLLPFLGASFIPHVCSYDSLLTSPRGASILASDLLFLPRTVCSLGLVFILEYSQVPQGPLMHQLVGRSDCFSGNSLQCFSHIS